MDVQLQMHFELPSPEQESLHDVVTTLLGHEVRREVPVIYADGY